MDKTSFNSFFERLLSITPIKNQSQLAKTLQVGRSAVSLAKQKNSVPSNWVIFLAQKYSLNSTWLATGQGLPYQSYDQKNQPYPAIKKVLAKLDNNGKFITDTDKDNFCPIIYDLRSVNQNNNSYNLVCLYMSGNSMEPEIKDGDILLIDQNKTSIYAGHIYAIGIEDTVLIRRIDKIPKALVLLSDNPRYTAYYIYSKEYNLISILGQVVSVGRNYAGF